MSISEIIGGKTGELSPTMERKTTDTDFVAILVRHGISAAGGWLAGRIASLARDKFPGSEAAGAVAVAAIVIAIEMKFDKLFEPLDQAARTLAHGMSGRYGDEVFDIVYDYFVGPDKAKARQAARKQRQEAMREADRRERLATIGVTPTANNNTPAQRALPAPPPAEALTMDQLQVAAKQIASDPAFLDVLSDETAKSMKGQIADEDQAEFARKHKAALKNTFQMMAA